MYASNRWCYLCFTDGALCKVKGFVFTLRAEPVEVVMDSFCALPPFHSSNGAEFLIRSSKETDISYAQTMSELIVEASKTSDIARRSVEELSRKIGSGMAALALRSDGDEPVLVGGAFLSTYDSEEFVSHSALIVDKRYRGEKLGKQIKILLMQMTCSRFPSAKIISLTTNPCVVKMNKALGFVVVSLADGPKDKQFWDGCKGCKSFCSLPVVSEGERACCCTAYLWNPCAPAET